MFNFSKIYDKINWRNKPDKTTPIDATNLGKIDTALDTIDNRVVELGKKANDTDDAINKLNSNLQDITKNTLGSTIDISSYTDSNPYITPSDGYIRIGSESITSGKIRVIVMSKYNRNATHLYMNINSQYEYNSLYVKAGMKIFMFQTIPDGASAVFIPFIP